MPTPGQTGYQRDVRLVDGTGTPITITSSGLLVVGNVTPGDAVATPSTASDVRAFLEAFNGATSDLLRSAGDNADGVATAALGRLMALARSYGFNGTTWDRNVSTGDNADGVAVGTTGRQLTVAEQYAFNGASYDRVRVPNVVKSAVVSGNGDNAVWTPAAGKKFRLQRFCLSLDGEAVWATGGRLLMLWRDATTAILNAWAPEVPTASFAGAGAAVVSTPWIDLGNGILSTVANNVLNLNLAGAITTGKVIAIVCGTEE